MTWVNHVLRWKDCQRCPLGQQRGRICLARACSSEEPPGARGGSVKCEVLFIGEAPGSSEDAVGLPFVGPAGDNLDYIRQQALPPGVRCAFTNLVACFPRVAKQTSNHQPKREEILACRERLVELVNLCQPRLIVCVGSLASQFVRHDDTVPCVDITHPAYVLAHLPLAQRSFETNKSVVRVARAYEDHVMRKTTPWREWGKEEKTTKTRSKREELKQTYEQAEIPFNDLNYDWDKWNRPLEGEDNIPF